MEGPIVLVVEIAGGIVLGFLVLTFLGEIIQALWNVLAWVMGALALAIVSYAILWVAHPDWSIEHFNKEVGTVAGGLAALGVFGFIVIQALKFGSKAVDTWRSRRERDVTVREQQKPL